jgi:ketopantoate reductase
VVDRIEGRATEWDARNAVVERIAKRHGIEVPLNRLMTTLIRLGEPDEGD